MVDKSWNSDDDKDMDNMAKSIANKESSVTPAQVTVMVLKEKLSNNANNQSVSSPQGHQTL